MNLPNAVSVALLVAALYANEAGAQTADDAHLQAFTRSDFYKGLINRAIAALPPTVFTKCPSLVSNGSRVTMLKPVSFGADGFPNAGMWKQSFPVSGCGNDTIVNFYFTAGADEKVNTLIGAPGSTGADLTLQRDALLYANMGAQIVAGDCKQFTVRNTKFEAFGLAKPATADPGPDSQFRPWWETWTMIGCGRIVDVPIDFVPNATGTQIIQPGGSVEHRD